MEVDVQQREAMSNRGDSKTYDNLTSDEIPTIFESCHPRSDVLDGSLAEEKFAADLSQVVYGDGSQTTLYDDANEFFEKTYPTDGLEKLLTNLMKQIVDQEGNSVVDLDTTFGGGKTHNLIAAYHFLNAPDAIRQPGRFVDPNQFEEYADAHNGQSIELAAFVGTNVDGLDASMTSEGLNSTNTIWGELAYRLEGEPGYECISEYDEQRIAPGKSSFGKVLNDDTHYVILLDELAEYLAGGSRVESEVEVDGEEVENLAESTLVFFKSLLQYASTQDNLTVIYTIADTAFADEAEWIREAVKDLDSIGKRKEWSITPTDDSEIASVLGYRLFERIDSEAAAEVAETYEEQLFDSPEYAVPPSVSDGEYGDRIDASYPFHPTTIDVLTQKVDSLSGFQKTRGALRLLSRAIYQCWNNRPEHYDRHLIRPYDLTLANPEIRSEAQDLFETVDLDSARRNDVWNQNGDAHAQVEDQKRKADELPPLGSHLATTIFWHSLSFSTDDTERGVTRGELNITVAHPQVRLDKYHDSLDNLTYEGGLNTDTACYYLHSDNNVYRFSAEATPSRILAEEREEVEYGAIRSEIEERVSGLKQGTGFDICSPEGPYDIPDDDGKPKLAVIHYETLQVENGERPPQRLTKYHQYRDDDGEPRVYKNNVVFLVADDEKKQDAVDIVRKLLARRNVLDKDKYESVLSPEQRQEVENLRDKLLVDTVIKQVYRHFYYPDGDDLSHIFLKDVDVGDHDSFEQIVLDAFDESGDPIALDAESEGRAAFYIQTHFFSNEVRLSTEEFVSRFRKNTEVPILLNPEPIKDTIVKCCQDSDYEFCYIDSSGSGYYNVTAASEADVEIHDPDAYENLESADTLSRYDVEISEDAHLYADVETFLEQEGEPKTCSNCDQPATGQYCDDCATCATAGCTNRITEHEIEEHDNCEQHREGPPTCTAEDCDQEIIGGPAFCGQHQTSRSGLRANEEPMGVLRALNEARDQLRTDVFDHGVPVLDGLRLVFTGNSAWDDAYDFVDFLDNPFAEVEDDASFEYQYHHHGEVKIDCSANGSIGEMPSSKPISQNSGEQQLTLSVTIEDEKIVGEESILDELIEMIEERSTPRGSIFVQTDAHNTPEGGI